MNYENYNNIYKEILDDKEGQLSANYLLNKYNIVHDEELINILNQIKKNEYINSDNELINKLINELDENEDILNINEIIDLKNKIINLEELNENYIEKDESIKINKIENQDNKRDKSSYHYRTSYFTKIIESISQFIKRVKTLILKYLSKIDFKEIKKFFSKIDLNYINNLGAKKYTLLIIPIFIVFISLISFNNNTSNTSSNPQLTNKDIISLPIVEETFEGKELTVPHTNIKATNLANSEKILNALTETEVNTVEDVEKISSENITKEENQNNQQIASMETIKLEDLNDISKYMKNITYDDDSIMYKDKIYKEGDDIFGFSIYKISSAYIKFEDKITKVRKRYLFK
ncbi:hypothetical protein [Arcobacter sp.]|uniref:hypothetical protein n=1 Tax=Arcobacter sp. TaxID=1872629 RepID=UPI003C762564